MHHILLDSCDNFGLELLFLEFLHLGTCQYHRRLWFTCWMHKQYNISMGQSSNNIPVTAGARNPQFPQSGSNQSSADVSNSRSSSNSNNYTSTSLWSSENSRVRRDGEELHDAGNLRVFTLPELRGATNNFRADTVIGEGGFGKVYKGWIKDRTSTNTSDGLTIAVEKLDPVRMQGVVEWQAEVVNSMARLSHPNIIKLGFGQEDSELLLVYEFMSLGTLDKYLFGKGTNFHPLSWDTTRALTFLHSLEEKIIITHRQLTTSNILLDQICTPKLSDFGLARYGPAVDHSHVSTGVMGAYGYAAPEYIATGHLYDKSDVYGFGNVVMEMLTGKKISDIISNLCQKKPLIDWLKSNLINRGKMRSTMDAKLEVKYPSNLALQLAHLTLKCIEDDPKVRPPSMKEVVETLEKIEATNEKLARNRNRATHSRALQLQ